MAAIRLKRGLIANGIFIGSADLPALSLPLRRSADSCPRPGRAAAGWREGEGRLSWAEVALAVAMIGTGESGGRKRNVALFFFLRDTFGSDWQQ